MYYYIYDTQKTRCYKEEGTVLHFQYLKQADIFRTKRLKDYNGKRYKIKKRLESKQTEEYNRSDNKSVWEIDVLKN